MIPKEYVSMPASDEAEITILGAGAYGESLVIHAGNNEWIIVDSCVDPNNNSKPLSLLYLDDIGISPKLIKLVVCTHWHDDHIRGLGSLLEAAENAEFCISRASDLDKFLSFVSMDFSKSGNHSTTEFMNCIRLLIKRKKSYVDAKENLVVFKNQHCKIICLSPSDYTAQQFDFELTKLMTEYSDPNLRIPYMSPNNKSIVLFALLGDHRAILGGDLEVVNSEDEGWKRILKNKITIDDKSSLLKISHHGSANGYYKDIWNHLLCDNPVAKMTPWKNGGRYLPQPDMIDVYKTHTNRLYITEIPFSNKQKSRDPQLEKLVKQFQPNLHEIKFKLGIIRSRIIMSTMQNDWKVETIMGAKHLNN